MLTLHAVVDSDVHCDDDDASVDTNHARILLVDDHRIFAQLFAAVLDREPDFTCVGIAGTCLEALDVVRRERPTLVVMDLRLGPEDGLEATRRIRAIAPETVVVIVSAHHESEWVARAAQAGANAFAPKTGSWEEMLMVLRRATLGSMLVSPSTFTEQAQEQLNLPRDVVPLSRRELAVLRLMADALIPDEIARVLNITVNTCRGYVKSIHLKLGVRSQLEAVVKAHRLGLIRIAVDQERLSYA